ncbi:MAG: radical SAM protein [Nanoarchaeota archaeon]
MNKIFYLDVNNLCNNNCIGCAYEPNAGKPYNLNLEDAENQIKDAAEKGYKILHPIGGEVTLNRDLIKIINLAKNHFPNIALTTNGRMFSYKNYAEKFKPFNINFNVSLCGPTKEIHEKWTQAENSFNQTIQGIENLKKLGKKVCLNIIIWKETIDVLNQYLEIIEKYNIDEVGILALGPFKRAKKRYKELNVKMIDLLKINSFLDKLNQLNLEVDIEDFPLCVFEKQHRENPKFHFQEISTSSYIDDKKEIETIGLFALNECNLPINSLELNKLDINEINDKISNYKTFLAGCENCSLKSKCSGIYTHYIKDYGEVEINKELKEIFQIKTKQNNERRLKFIRQKYLEKKQIPSNDILTSWKDTIKIDKKNYGLYIHIPFCKQICLFCNCYTKKYDFHELKLYLNLLYNQIDFFKSTFKEISFNTLYFGGGTPSILPIPYLEQLLEKIFNSFKFKDYHFSFEFSPKTFSLEKLKLLKKYNLTRINIGIQSFNENTLNRYGRENVSYNELLEFVKISKKNNIKISFEIIRNLNNDGNSNNIKNILRLNPDQIQIYDYTFDKRILDYQNQTLDSEKLHSLKNQDPRIVKEKFKSEFLKNNYKLYPYSDYAKDQNSINKQLYKLLSSKYNLLGLGSISYSFNEKLRYATRYTNEIKYYPLKKENNLLD